MAAVMATTDRKKGNRKETDNEKRVIHVKNKIIKNKEQKKKRAVNNNDTIKIIIIFRKSILNVKNKKYKSQLHLQKKCVF